MRHRLTASTFAPLTARRTRHEGDAAHEAATVRAASSVAVDWRVIACGRIDNGVGLVGRGRGFEGDQPPAAREVVAPLARKP